MDYFLTNKDASVGLYRVRAVKAIRDVCPGLNLRETLIVIANTFGFYADYVDDLSGWYTFRQWQNENRVSLEMVQGSHAMTILKMIAIKYGRGQANE